MSMFALFLTLKVKVTNLCGSVTQTPETIAITDGD